MATFDSDTVAETKSSSVTRRELLIAAAASGATLAATAWGASQVGTLTTRAQYEIELTKLRALLTLYEQLERVGLDAILATGMNMMRGVLDTTRTGVRLMRDGITAVETALKNFQAMLDGLRTAVNNATRLLTDLSQKLRIAETVIVSVVGAALPIAESIASFFNALLDKIPFGICDEIRRSVNALVDLIRAIPTTIDGLTTQLFKPLRDTFFPLTGDAAVKTNLTDPILNNLLNPLKQFLNSIEDLLNRWEKDFAKPIQGALDERQVIRKQIAEFRKEHAV